MSLVTGTRLGPYEILHPLGAGGMGEVYCARDGRLDRSVAIKVLTSSRPAGATELERFRREARAIARLTHPHICTLYDVGDQDGITFLVMELLEGETLAERLEQGPFSIEQALAIGLQIAEALDAAHRKDIVHRDLKPANLIFAAGGVKLLDFGLAKLREAEYDDIVRGPTKTLQLTGEGTVLGTVPYMAPEQIERHQADSRTDIFALGVVMYELIAGRRPFDGDTGASLMVAIVSREPESLIDIRPEVPAALERLIRRCLAKDPDERWQTARDLAAELRWIADGRPAARPVPRTQVGRRGRRALVSLGLVALSGGVVAAIMTIRPRPIPVPEYQPVTYRRGMVSSARFAPGGQSFVYSASWEGQPYGVFLGRAESPDARDLELDAGRILSISRTGEMAVLFGPQNVEQTFGVRTLARVPMAGGARRDVLEAVVDADWIPDTDRFAVIRDPGGGRPWTVEFPAGTIVHQAPAAWSLRVSPDGKRIAFFEGPTLFSSAPDSMITVVDRSGRKSTLSRNWAGLGLAWTPSGSEIWFTATRGGVSDPKSNTRAENRPSAPSLQAISLSGAQRTVVRAPDWLVLHDIAADGSVLLSRNTIRIGMACQPPGETLERDLSWLVASFVTGLSADGRTAIFFDPLSGLSRSGNPTLFRRSLDGSPAVPLGEGTSGTLSPDGRSVLASLGGSLVLLPAGAGSSVVLPKGTLSRVGAGAWLPDSKRVVFDGVRGTDQSRIYVQEIPAGEPVPISEEGVKLSSKATVRDESTVLGVAGNRWMLFSLADGDPQPVPALTLRDIPLQWSSDGRSLYTVERVEAPRPAGFQVVRVEIATGRRALWKTLAPPDPVGVEDHRERTVITPNARSYCYSYLRRLGDLFVVTGLQ